MAYVAATLARDLLVIPAIGDDPTPEWTANGCGVVGRAAAFGDIPGYIRRKRTGISARWRNNVRSSV